MSPCVCGMCVCSFHFIFFSLQGTSVLFAWKTLFMKSIQLGGISEMSQSFCGLSICQWPAMLHEIKWVS